MVFSEIVTLIIVTSIQLGVGMWIADLWMYSSFNSMINPDFTETDRITTQKRYQRNIGVAYFCVFLILRYMSINDIINIAPGDCVSYFHCGLLMSSLVFVTSLLVQ